MNQIRLIKLVWITLVCIYLVTIAGSVVRATGSGMGCPDWPKCFDSYIPPTSVKQLPNNYKEIYSNHRKEKLDRFITFLNSLGFNKEANQLANDPNLLVEQDFNVFHTYTEYINRLTGAVAGLLVLLQAVLFSLKFRQRKLLSIYAWLLVFLTSFQAWFGAMVVATNIVPWVLSVHMFIAMLMIALQILILQKLKANQQQTNIGIKLMIVFGLIITLIQTIIGLKVRQEIDLLNSADVQRGQWLDQLSSIFTNHQIIAFVLIALTIVLFVMNMRSEFTSRIIYYTCLAILIEWLVGMSFGISNMSAILQPIHLLFSLITFGFLFYTLIYVKTK